MNPYKIDIGAVYSHRVRLHAAVMCTPTGPRVAAATLLFQQKHGN